MNIGETLKAAREEMGLSQSDVAERTGMLRTYISRLENGHMEPTIRVLHDVCVNGLGLNLSEFFARAEQLQIVKRKAA